MPILKLRIRYMKRIHVITYLLLLLIGTGCQKPPKDFELFVYGETTLPANPPLNLPVFTEVPEIVTSISSQLANKNVSVGYINSIKPTKLALAIHAPAGKTFRFLESVRFFLRTDQLSDFPFAYRSEIPDSIGNTLEFVIDDVELGFLLSDPTAVVRVETVSDEPNTEVVTMGIQARFLVDVNLEK